MIAKLQISDLHLGDPRSTLSNPEIAARVVDQIVELSGGNVGQLIVAGDAHEECVPGDMTHLMDGVAYSVLKASQDFFDALYKQVKVGETIVVPGNHDLCTWAWYRQQKRISPITPYEGELVSAGDWPWCHLYPGANALRFAYPIYWDKAASPDYPIHVVTHGHLCDPLVLGWDSPCEYDALAALGCFRPSGLNPSIPTDAAKIAGLTFSFITKLWSRYSPRDYAYANYVMRRLVHPQSCRWQQILPNDGFFPTDAATCAEDAAPSSQDYILGNLPWFLTGLVMDPNLPTPVGSLRQGDPAPAALTRPSCLSRGHDHLGTFRTVAAAGVPWVDASSGGWTSEFEGHLPHAHSLVWKEANQVVPEVYFHRARTRAGTLL